MDTHAFGWLGFANYQKYCAHLVLEGFRASERILGFLKKMFIRLGKGTLVLLLQPPQTFTVISCVARLALNRLRAVVAVMCGVLGSLRLFLGPWFTCDLD